jgi:Flp pilus assembly protein TadG
MKIATTYSRSRRQSIRLPHRQKGVVLVLIAVGMLAIVAMGALALDVSHVLLNKSKLQNTVDMAALAGARALDDKGNSAAAVDAARVAAMDIFDANVEADGNNEIVGLAGSTSVKVQFSVTLEPFTAGATTGAEYVRVAVDPMTLPSWLMQVLPNGGQKRVSASAVAGPSPTLGAACDVVPLVICALDIDAPPNYGYETDTITVLKSGSKTVCDSGEIGGGEQSLGGNFSLARLDEPGIDEVRKNLAGGYEGCTELGAIVPTQPGDGASIAQGINVRLNKFDGPIKPGDYLPDVISEALGQGNGDPNNPRIELAENKSCNLEYDGNTITDPADLPFSYDDYLDRLSRDDFDHAPPAGAFDRRNMAVLIADCGGNDNNGLTPLPIVGFGCFFLLQTMDQGGQEPMYGQFLKECNAKGVVGPEPVDNPGPYIIQLYNDSTSKDS